MNAKRLPTAISPRVRQTGAPPLDFRTLLLDSVKLHRSRLALIASDHLPLIAEFRLKTA